MQLTEAPCYREVPTLCSLVLKFVAFKRLCYTNDSITPPFKCASGDSVLLPESEERMKLTSANSPCPRHLYYDFLLKPYLSYNEFSPSTREEAQHLHKLIFVCVQVNTQMRDPLTVWRWVPWKTIKIQVFTPIVWANDVAITIKLKSFFF